jgi:pimeloyl-ACP methyl ester carboxylesterase
MRLAVLAAALCVCAGGRVHAQQDEEARPVVLQAERDRFPIHITYYPAKKDENPSGVENAPVVVMLHGENGSRLVWDRSSAPPGGVSLAEFLHSRGYAVVTVDLRKFGESLPEGEARAVQPTDYALMARRDLPAVKAFLHEEHEAKRLNVAKLGIIASDMSVPVAADYAERDWRLRPYADGPGGGPGTPRGQEVKAMVLLSPDTARGQVITARSLNFLKNPTFGIAFMVIVGTRDALDRNQARDTFRIVSGARNADERTELVQKNSNARGTDLLGNPALGTEVDIVRFLDAHLKDLDIPWETRISRYDRVRSP